MISGLGKSGESTTGLAARAAVLDVVESVLAHRQTLDDAVAGSVGFSRLDDRDRAFALALCGQTLRHLGTIDHIMDTFLDRPLPRRHGRIRTVVRLGLCQVLFMDVADHAATDTSVRLVRAEPGGAGLAKLTNAVLRRALREKPALLADSDHHPERNIPPWLRERWAAGLGAQTMRAIAAAHRRPVPLDLTLREAARAEYWADHLNGEILPTGSLRLAAPGRVEVLPGFVDGAWWVQDAAAALPAQLFGDISGQSVIDLCAAPGGKTLQLAAAGAAVTAVDRSQKRMKRLRDNLARTGLEAETVIADARTWTPSTIADHVLLDAPCLATGTARRHPDALWIKTAGMLDELTALQARLLDKAAESVKPGGSLVYCVCSLEPEEGPDQIARFLERHAHFTRIAVTAEAVGGHGELVDRLGNLRTLPCHLAQHGGMDGFFAARLRRER